MTTQTMSARATQAVTRGRAWATDLRLGGLLLTVAGSIILSGFGDGIAETG